MGKVAAKIRKGEYEQIKTTDRSFPIREKEKELLNSYFCKVAGDAQKYLSEAENTKWPETLKKIRVCLKCVKPNAFDWAAMRKQAENYEKRYRAKLGKNENAGTVQEEPHEN